MIKKIFSLFAAILFAGSMMATDYYVKVTEAPTDWSGDYLIVYGGDKTHSVAAFDGGLATLDAKENGIAVTISDGKIEANATTNAAKFTIASMTGGYSIKAANGKYIGATSYANRLDAQNTAIANSLSLDESGNAVIGVTFTSGTVTLRYNYASDQLRFRYYKSGQQAIQLYKLESGSTDPDACATPSFSPAAGSHLGTQHVTISSKTDDAVIYYTIGENPADPTTESTLYTGAIEVSANTTIKAIATKAEMTNSAVATAAYTIYNTVHAGTAEDPYSIDDACLAIDYGTSSQNEGKYVSGIVSKIVTTLNSDGQISYDISADGTTSGTQFRAYKGKNQGGAVFTSNDDVKVGDEVVVLGNLTKYNSTYELDENNTIYSQSRTIVLTIANVANLAEGTTLTVEDLDPDTEGSDGVVTLVSSTNEAAVKIVDNALQAVKAGDATITANIAQSGIYKAATTTFTVHVYAPCTNFVTLSEGTPEHGSFTIDLEYKAHPSCEADVVVKVTPDADEHYHVSEIIAPNSTSISSPDSDGKYTVTYEQGTNAASKINVEFAEDAKSTITWSVNGDESLQTEVYTGEKPASFPSTPAAFDATSTTFIGWADAAWGGKVAEPTATIYKSASEMPVVNSDVTYFAVFAKEGAGSAFDGVHGGKFIIYAIVNETNYYATGTVSASKIAPTMNESEAAEFEISAVTDGFTIKSGDNYITYTGSTNLGTSTTAYKWTIETGTNGSWRVNSGTDGRAWIYRAGSQNKFGGYATSNATSTSTEYFDLEIMGTVSYSDYVTITPAHTYTLAWSLGAGANEELGEMDIVLDLEYKATDSYKKYFDKEILQVGTYDVKLFEDGVATAITTTLEINAVAKYYLQFDYDSANGDLTATASNPRTPTSVDNTVDGKKAVKFIENGQLFIELNGHIYNVQGAVVR